MSTPVRASDRDLRALAAIVSEDRPDLPDGEGLPPSLLADLMAQIRCDSLSLDSSGQGAAGDCMVRARKSRLATPASGSSGPRPGVLGESLGLPPCSYTARTGDQRSVITIADFYSARQWHSTGMYTDFYRPMGMEHDLHGVPAQRAAAHSRAPSPCAAEPLNRAVYGSDFSSVTGRCSPCWARTWTGLTWMPRGAATRSPAHPRQRDLLRLLAAGHTNAQIAGRLGISRGNGAHAPGKYLRTAARLQPHRRRHPRLPRPGCLGPAKPIACDARGRPKRGSREWDTLSAMKAAAGSTALGSE